ncbi:hypothetical protein [Hymenobacter ruricola]|uniref:SGNH/GDSL hydrolase family protein n=1 Tax=Hymenobacter ruricola TaxID=2791023 RepID=A0ABS0HZH9_9BACT|nr:hypothetical protein [Hymenobacter ruricola]MBF9220106.1 hypothetical protein [Hymenobacter ruricola]
MADTSRSSARGSGRLLRKVLLLSLPLVAILVSYLVLDPFRVLRRYATFDQRLVAVPNRDYTSTQMYLNTYERRPHHSFILGDSRTMAFLVRDWEPYIHDTAAFHYDASSESLYGVWKKLQFLEQHGARLKNVLIVGDADLLEQTHDTAAHLLRKDPRTTGSSRLRFQGAFVKAYLSNLFFYQFIRLRLTGKFRPGMRGLLESRRIYYDPVTNDLVLPELNEEIRRDSLDFYARNERLKAARRPGVSAAVIGPAQLRQLVAIRAIFARHQTRYHFVISPLFNQKQLNPADLAVLKRVFGASAIHDFSGANAFTAQAGNYYEDAHYRPLVGRAILQQIYSGSFKPQEDKR